MEIGHILTAPATGRGCSATDPCPVRRACYRADVEELLEFVPQTAIERKMVEARAGECSKDELIEALLGASILVGSSTNMTPDGEGFSPLLMKAQDDVVIAAFTTRLRLVLYPEYDRHSFEMRWRDFILSIPPGKGAVINPGYTHQIVIPAGEVRNFKSWLGFPQMS